MLSQTSTTRGIIGWFNIHIVILKLVIYFYFLTTFFNILHGSTDFVFEIVFLCYFDKSCPNVDIFLIIIPEPTENILFILLVSY